MFAFVLGHAERLFTAQNRCGIKPFYDAVSDGDVLYRFRKTLLPVRSDIVTDPNALALSYRKPKTNV
jgi:asparagine synthetase B (glutamine-hydrolysing)